VVFDYAAGFLGSGSAIFEIDIKSMKRRVLLGRKYSKPLYSPNGEKLLLTKYVVDRKSNSIVSKVCVYDFRKKKVTDIGFGEFFLWKPQY
jgi:hypothetical protein